MSSLTPRLPVSSLINFYLPWSSPIPVEGPTTVPSSEDDVKAAYARLQSLVSLSAESVLSSNLLPEFSTWVTRRMRSSVLSAEQKTCLGVFSDPRLYCNRRIPGAVSFAGDRGGTETNCGGEESSDVGLDQASSSS